MDSFPIQDLPTELIWDQAFNMSLPELYNLCSDNPELNAILCDNERFWQQKFIKDFQIRPPTPESWKQLYQEYSAIWGVPGSLREYIPSTFNLSFSHVYYRPVRINDEMCQFFAHARLGPLVEGQLVDKVLRDGSTRREAVQSTLRPTDAPLNRALFFTQPTVLGQPNPLYGIVTLSWLTKLFVIHAFYSRMAHPEDTLRLRVSDEMIHLLPATINQTIMQDVDEITQAIREGRPYQDITIFNPYYFMFPHINKLLKTAIVRQVSDEELETLAPEVARVYGPLFPQNEQVTPEVVLRYQSDQITIAREYIRKISQEAAREARRIRRDTGQPTQAQLPAPQTLLSSFQAQLPELQARSSQLQLPRFQPRLPGFQPQLQFAEVRPQLPEFQPRSPQLQFPEAQLPGLQTRSPQLQFPEVRPQLPGSQPRSPQLQFPESPPPGFQ